MFVTVASFLDPLEARIVHGRLTAEGIEGYLADEQQAINDWYMRQALGGVKIRVLREQADEARGLISQLAEGALALEDETADPAAMDAVNADSLSQRLAFLGFFTLGLPLPWRRRRQEEV